MYVVNVLVPNAPLPLVLVQSVHVDPEASVPVCVIPVHTFTFAPNNVVAYESSSGPEKS